MTTNFFQPPINQVSSMAQYGYKTYIDTTATIAVKNADTANCAFLENQRFRHQMELKGFEANILAKKNWTLENNRRNREASVETLIEDSDGRLCLEISRPDGSRTLSQPIVGVSAIKGEIIFARDMPEKFLRITWSGCEKPVIVRYDCSTKSFAKAIRSAGLMLKAPRNRMCEISERLQSFLLSRADCVEIAKSFGWNEFSDGAWRFCYENEMNMEDIAYETK